MAYISDLFAYNLAVNQGFNTAQPGKFEYFDTDDDEEKCLMFAETSDGSCLWTKINILDILLSLFFFLTLFDSW